MKRVVYLICFIIILSFSSCSGEKTVSVTETQKAYAQELFQFAKNVNTIDVYGSDSPYYLNQIKLYENNNSYYYGFCYYDNTLQNAIRENDGRITTLITTEHTYSVNGLVRCDGVINSNHAVTASASWNSSNSYEGQMQQLYQIVQFL